MIRENWRSPAFWRWWWRNAVPAEVKIPLAFVLVGLLLFGGYFAAGQLGGASAADGSSSYVLETTVRKVVTVREHGKLVVKRVPVVVHRSVTRTKTAYQTNYQTVVQTVVHTHYVTTPARVRDVVKEVVRTVTQVLPVERVVRVTVTDTQTVTDVATVTVTSAGP